ncbi:uncharacterized protein LOC114332838 [Diabrotica virgifera virgifera]|uniref:27 kDa hemolymph protein-like n=1 Tax=Diabrotica virgifera virgifera TaxID=50390 RepID=A0ABM5IPW0_DIAVI|nr:uncharacterized protein LOC114332838 [Diabrotica virgifera virgifera]
MLQVNLKLYIILFIFLIGELTINHVICTVTCEEDKLLKFLAGIQVWSPESIFDLAIIEQEAICNKLEEKLKNVEKYYTVCKQQNPHSLYVTLVAGVKALNDKVCCLNQDFFRQFLIYHPCLYELRDDFEECNGPPDWTEHSQTEKLCKNYKSILDCYYVKTAKVCGKDAALTITSLITDVIDNTITHSCKRIKKFPVVKDIMPESYIKGGSPKMLVPDMPIKSGTIVHIIPFLLYFILL